MIPRVLRLHPKTHQRLIALRKEAERDGAYRVAKRMQAVVLNSEGRTSGELAEILKAPRSRVSEWLLRYEAHGVEGLLASCSLNTIATRAQSSSRTMPPIIRTQKCGAGSRPIAIGWKYTNYRHTPRS